jgi:ribosomal protein L12E/L44/L45/RPP1/RPP2
MSTALGLAMQISANTAQLAQAVADVNQKLDAMGQAGVKASKDLGTLKNIEIGRLALDGIQAATGAFTSLAGAVTGAATRIASFALNAGKQLDALNDVANRTGVGVEALQAYSRAAAENGVEIESFAKQIQKLTVNIGKATLDEKAQKSFKDLGIVFSDLKALSPEKQFETIVDALSRIADPTERAARAVQFFGKGGIELGELFTQGPGYLESIRRDTEALGGIIKEDAVKEIDNMFDRFGRVQTVVTNLSNQILGELAGPIGQIAEDLLGVIRAAGPQQLAQNIAQGLLSFIELAGGAFFELAKFIEAFVKKFAPILGLDIRSDTEKLIEELRNEQIRLGERDPTGGFAGAPNANTPEAQARQRQIDILTARLEGQQADSALNRLQANFNAAINNAQDSLAQRQRETATGEAVVVQEDQLNEQRRTNRLLEQQATAPVEIAGGG